MGKINSVIGSLFGINANVAAFEVADATDINDENYNIRNVLSSNTKSNNTNGVENMDLSVDSSKTTTSNTSDSNVDGVSSEDIENLVGSMSQEEYDQYVEGVQDYYQQQEDLINETVFGEDGFNDILNNINTIYDKYDTDYAEIKQYYADDLTNEWYNNPNLYESGTTYDEFMNMSYTEKITFLDGKSETATGILNKEKEAVTMYDEKVAAECSDYGIYTMEELINSKDQLTETVATARESLQELENLKNSAEYDYLYFLDDFSNYEMKTEFTENELKELDDCFKVVGENGLEAYQYSEYVKTHPDVTLTEFALMVYQYDTNAICCDENGNSIMSKDVYDVTKISSVNTDFAKVYQYLLETDPEKASEYVDACKYEINDYQGQIEAQEFLETLYESNGDPIEAICNEFNITEQGLVDGLGTFGEGVYYSSEAIFTALGMEENRTQSVEEYKKTYILQSLMSTEDKLKYNLIYKDDDGNLHNSNTNSAIDYTVDYSGIWLDDNYEISQGIGNMAPSIVMNTVTPGFGLTALGISAGGNAYHGAMVDGSDYAASVFYGVCTGLSESVTEKMLGGIPGLSDTQVNSLSSYVKAVGKEGMQESFQECLDITTRCLVLDEELPTTVDGWKSLGAQVYKAGKYGAITAGIMNVPGLVFNSDSNKNSDNNVNSTNSNDTSGSSNGIPTEVVEELAETATETSTATDTEVEVENTTDIENTQTDEVEELDLSEEVTNESTKDIEKTTTEDTSANSENTSVDYEAITQQISEEGVTILNGKSGTEVIDIITYCQETGQIDLINEIMSYDNVNEQYFIDMTSTILESSLNYYENAAEYAQNASEFKTYRDHCEKHVQEVAIKALQACENIKTALESDPVNGFSSDIDPYECFVAGIWHDTGMAAGSDNVFGLNSYVDADNNIKAEVLHDNSNGALTRSNHSFNSAMYVLANSAEISAYGVDTNLVALLCFAHSKSNSGVSTLNSASDWSVCINKINEGVIEYNKQNPNSPITFSNTGGTDFIESLVASGVLDNTDYTEKVYTYTKKGITYTFNYKEYNINSDTLGKLASEAYALRLGDANTNNSNIGTNQAGQKIDFSSVSGDKNISFETTTVDKDGNTVNVSDHIGDAIKQEVPNLSIKVGDETINLEPIGAAFVLGEENIDFSSTTKDGVLVEKFSIKDPSDIPACTAFNIEERLGEVKTASKGGFETAIEIELDSTNISEAQKDVIYNYYDNFMKTKGYDYTITWK